MLVSDNQTVILGPPGGGKTTSLLAIVDKCFQEGIKPHEIAFVSFSKRATQEALHRACVKFGFKSTDLPFFRTLHSLAFHQLGIRSNEVMRAEDYNSLGELLKAPFTTFTEKDAPENVADFGIEKKGDFMLFMESLARARLENYRQTYDKYHAHKVSWLEFERFAVTYREFREYHAINDFTDMLTQFVTAERPVGVRVAIIDEAQDLSKLQWLVCQTAFSNCERVFIAGDDDQAIFKWAGADTESFLTLGGTKLVLAKSHRLPIAVHNLANKISSGIRERYIKEFTPREEQGAVKRVRELEHVQVSDDGTWLWLARNSIKLAEIERVLRRKSIAYMTKHGSSIKALHVGAIQAWEALRAGNEISGQAAMLVFDHIKVGDGIGATSKRKLHTAAKDEAARFTLAALNEKFGLTASEIWHDALTNIKLEQREYYLSMMRRGIKLTDPIRHTVSTIHGAKGAEADNVVLLSDMGANTYEAYSKNPDDEKRVFYVGVTRAKQNLFIVDPQGIRGFKFPHF